VPIAVSPEQRALQASIREWLNVVAERALGLPREEAR
jgi:hypothetical protein